MKTNELTGAALDWAVAKAEGKNGVLHDDGITRCIVVASPSGVYKGRWMPTVNWAQGGPIMEREITGVDLVSDWKGIKKWSARKFEYLPNDQTRCTERYGPTPLVAAMRCYVASKLGDTVEVPEELTMLGG